MTGHRQGKALKKYNFNSKYLQYCAAPPNSPAHSATSTSFDEQSQHCTPNTNVIAATATSSCNSGPSTICNATITNASSVMEARTPSRPSSPLPANDNCDYNNSIHSPNNISVSATISNSRSVSPTSPNHQHLDHPPLPMQTNSSRPSTPSSVQSLSLPTSPQSTANPTASSTLLTETKDKLKQEKKERHATKKLMKELASCKTMLDEMEVSPSDASTAQSPTLEL